MVIQCQDGGLSIHNSVLTEVQKKIWRDGVCTQEEGITFAASQEQPMHFNSAKAIPAMTLEVPWFLFRFENLEQKHLHNALWSCQNGIWSFISTSRKSPFPFWLNIVCQKWKVLWLHSWFLREPWGATTFSKIIPCTLANRGSAFSYTQNTKHFK